VSAAGPVVWREKTGVVRRCASRAPFLCALFLLLPGVGGAVDMACDGVEQGGAQAHAAWLGHRVDALREALHHPYGEGAMDAVVALGRDSRYYVMVRGWLGFQLQADLSIVEARQGDVPADLAARIAFLRRAIRAIDLE